MEITNLSNDVKFKFNDYREVYKKKSYSSGIYVDRKLGRIILNFGGEPGDVLDVKFLFSEVTSPVTGSLDDLVTVLRGYLDDDRIEAGIFTLAIGSNTITFSNPLPSADYTLVCNDMDGVGFDAPSLYTQNGFTVTNVLGIGRIAYHAIMN